MCLHSGYMPAHKFNLIISGEIVALLQVIAPLVVARYV